MKTLKEMSAPLKAVCGQQKYEEGMPYRLSAFVIPVEAKDGLRMYHTMTGELVLLEAGETTESCRKQLVSRYFMVPDDFDELRYEAQVRKVLQVLKGGSYIDHYTILTTTDCNARCFYCYELGRSRIPMSEEIARDTVKYMLKNAQGRKLRLRWFGGEPLYNRKAIELICDLLTEKGAEFTSSMITNGLYLTEETVKEAVEKWHLKKVQITLDGPKEEYKRIKAYIDKEEDPFGIVIQNIQSCIDHGVRVQIRLNVSALNAEKMFVLCEQLGAYFGGQKGIRVYTAVVRDFRPGREYTDYTDVWHKTREIEQKLAEYGLYYAGRLSKEFGTSHCMADDDHSEIILPDGRTGRCEHYSETEITGSIYSDKKDQEMMDSWKEVTDLEECKSCPMVPLCSRLKKCEWTQPECSKAGRMMKIEGLKEQILNY